MFMHIILFPTLVKLLKFILKQILRLNCSQIFKFFKLSGSLNILPALLEFGTIRAILINFKLVSFAH